MSRYWIVLFFSTLLNASEECSISSTIPPMVPLSVHIPCNGSSLSINAAYTLWTAREEGLTVPLSTFPMQNTPPNTTGISSLFTPLWKVRSGFKTGATLFLDYDCWDLTVEYTWFWNKHNRLAPLFSGDSLYFSFFPKGSLFLVNSAEALWNNWFNRIDLTLGKPFYLGSYFSCNPFLGVLGAFEKQWFDVEYTITTPNVITQNNSQKWWAVGPYTGCAIAFTCNDSRIHEFSFFLEGGFTLGLGRYTTKNLSFTKIDGIESFLANVRNSSSNISPMAELTLGIRWQNFWSACCDNSSFLLQAAWETQVWFNHNQMAIMNAKGMSNNYSMQGLTIKAQVAF